MPYCIQVTVRLSTTGRVKTEVSSRNSYGMWYLCFNSCTFRAGADERANPPRTLEVLVFFVSQRVRHTQGSRAHLQHFGHLQSPIRSRLAPHIGGCIESRCRISTTPEARVASPPATARASPRPRSRSSCTGPAAAARARSDAAGRTPMARARRSDRAAASRPP